LPAALAWYVSQQRQIVAPPKALTAKTWIDSPIYRANDGLAEQVGVANVSAGATGYSDSIDASYDQVVKVELIYFGCRAAESIYDITPEVVWPNTSGQNRDVTIRLTDANDVRLSASVVIHVSDPRDRLVYEAGTTVWEHSADDTDQDFKEQKLADSMLGGWSPLESIPPDGAGSVNVPDARRNPER
jgi:hypothetical protein